MAVVGHRGGNVDPDEVQRPERCALRPADERPGQVVDLVRPDAQLLGEPEGDHEAVNAEPVRDERRRVARDDGPLSEVAGGVVTHRINAGRVGLVHGNELEEARVARRVEEMRPQKAAPEPLAAPLAERADRQAARVRADPARAVGEDGVNPLEQPALRLRLLHDRLEHPVGIGHRRLERALVVQAAGADAVRV